jgi:hypothetical protein
VLGTLGAVLYFSRRRGLSIRPRLLPRPRLDVLPQSDLIESKRVATTMPSPQVATAAPTPKVA